MSDITITTLRLPRDMDNQLNQVVKETGSAKAHIIRMSICRFLREWTNDTKQ